MYYAFAGTPAGTLLLTGDGETVNGLHWEVFRRRPQVEAGWVENEAVFSEVRRQLGEYFDGARTDFDFACAASGTEFQMSVWRELAKIPYGGQSSYQVIATTIGRPGAVRAVGTAVGSNPLSIVVPCHRVLTSSGKLAGYAGGLESKMLLLRREGISFTLSRGPSANSAL